MLDLKRASLLLVVLQTPMSRPTPTMLFRSKIVARQRDTRGCQGVEVSPWIPGAKVDEMRRSRRGIVFYRRRVLHSVLPSLAVILGAAEAGLSTRSACPSVLTRPRPICDIGWIYIPQCSAAVRDVISIEGKRAPPQVYPKNWSTHFAAPC